jgi:flagellar protein FliO/FliZ
MQFLTSLFGGSENTLLNAGLALAVVLMLIVFGLWVLKFFFNASNTLARRNKRLTIIDTIALDARRHLFIVRRDNVEHLILTGGPQDVVVEAGIPAEKPGAVPVRRSVPATAPAAERPAPSQPVTDALEAAQALVASPSARGPMERLRDLGRPVGQRKSGSLRHTGLMRPVSRMEPAAIIPINPDNSDRRRIDSAKTAPHGETGQAELGGGKHLGDGVKAEGN